MLLKCRYAVNQSLQKTSTSRIRSHYVNHVGLCLILVGKLLNAKESGSSLGSLHAWWVQEDAHELEMSFRMVYGPGPKFGFAMVSLGFTMLTLAMNSRNPEWRTHLRCDCFWFASDVLRLSGLGCHCHQNRD